MGGSCSVGAGEIENIASNQGDKGTFPKTNVVMVYYSVKLLKIIEL